jgi:hypothetical protein
MADNAAAISLLTQKITAMQVIQQSLTTLYTNATDLDLSDSIRTQLTQVNEDLFALQSERNALAESSTVVPPPTADEIQQLNDTLKQLDAYVQTDQNVHMALSYLQQVADQIKKA